MHVACEGRSLLFIENGYYAPSPRITEAWDPCCVIFGVKVPYILRKAEKESQCNLVGEAYVHGLMRGEIKTMLENGTVHAQDITLR